MEVELLLPRQAFEEHGKPYLRTKSTVGKAPFHSKASNQFRFEDIDKRIVHHIGLTKGPISHRSVALSTPVRLAQRRGLERRMDSKSTNARGVTTNMEGDDGTNTVGAKERFAALNPKSKNFVES